MNPSWIDGSFEDALRRVADLSVRVKTAGIGETLSAAKDSIVGGMTSVGDMVRTDPVARNALIGTGVGAAAGVGSHLMGGRDENGKRRRGLGSSLLTGSLAGGAAGAGMGLVSKGMANLDANAGMSQAAKTMPQMKDSKGRPIVIDPKKLTPEMMEEYRKLSDPGTAMRQTALGVAGKALNFLPEQIGYTGIAPLVGLPAEMILNDRRLNLGDTRLGKRIGMGAINVKNMNNPQLFGQGMEAVLKDPKSYPHVNEQLLKTIQGRTADRSQILDAILNKKTYAPPPTPQQVAAGKTPKNMVSIGPDGNPVVRMKMKPERNADFIKARDAIGQAYKGIQQEMKPLVKDMTKLKSDLLSATKANNAAQVQAIQKRMDSVQKQTDQLTKRRTQLADQHKELVGRKQLKLDATGIQTINELGAGKHKTQEGHAGVRTYRTPFGTRASENGMFSGSRGRTRALAYGLPMVGETLIRGISEENENDAKYRQFLEKLRKE